MHELAEYDVKCVSASGRSGDATALQSEVTQGIAWRGDCELHQ